MPALVNAAGPQGGDVAAIAGIALPVEPRKRSVFVVDCREKISGVPLIVDISGAWLRPEGGRFICGISPRGSADPRAAAISRSTTRMFDELVWPALAHRIPAFEAIKVVILGRALRLQHARPERRARPHPGLENFYFANGFSGHGIQQAPAVAARWPNSSLIKSLYRSTSRYSAMSVSRSVAP